jgi:hypothetical protein
MLIDRRHRRRIIALSGASAVLALISAGTTLLKSDLYREVLPDDAVFGALGFDFMSVVVALSLIACLWALERGHQSAWLLWSGLQGYLLYAYALYAFDVLNTPVYLLYIAILGLSVFAFVQYVRAFNMRTLRRWHPGDLPREAMAGTLYTIAGMFAAAWTYMLLAAAVRRAQLPPGTVIVLDLAFTLPLLVIVATMLAKHRPLGDLLAPGVFALSATITLGVALGEFIRPAFGETFDLGVAAPYLLPGVVSLAFAIFAFLRVAPALPRATHHQEAVP